MSAATALATSVHPCAVPARGALAQLAVSPDHLCPEISGSNPALLSSPHGQARRDPKKCRPQALGPSVPYLLPTAAPSPRRH